MFVYSVKASTLKFIAAISVSVFVMLFLVLLVPTFGRDKSVEASDSVSFSDVKTNDDRIAFLSQFGYTVKETPVTEEKVTIPSSFDSVFVGYNNLQKEQGLDLSKYKRKEVMHYKYEVTNYEGYEGTVWANLLIYRGRVIGGDICSADINGFIHGFEKENKG